MVIFTFNRLRGEAVAGYLRSVHALYAHGLCSMSKCKSAYSRRRYIFNRRCSASATEILLRKLLAA